MWQEAVIAVVLVAVAGIAARKVWRFFRKPPDFDSCCNIESAHKGCDDCPLNTKCQ
jgi:hypothetical protein